MLWENVAKLLNEAFTVGNDPVKKEILERTGRGLNGGLWSEPDRDPALPLEDEISPTGQHRPSEAAPS